MGPLQVAEVLQLLLFLLHLLLQLLPVRLERVDLLCLGLHSALELGQLQGFLGNELILCLHLQGFAVHGLPQFLFV